MNMVYCLATVLNGSGTVQRLQLSWHVGFLTFSSFHYPSFSDEPNSACNDNDQRKTKKDNKEINSTKQIFGIQSSCSSADSNC